MNLKNLSFNKIADSNVQYTEYLKTLIIRYGEAILTTSWNEVSYLSQFTNNTLDRKVYNRFPSDEIRRIALVMFVKIFKEGFIKKPSTVKNIWWRPATVPKPLCRPWNRRPGAKCGCVVCLTDTAALRLPRACGAD